MMAVNIKIYIRDIYWKSMTMPEETQFINIALLTSTSDIRTLRAPVYRGERWEEVTATIEDEDIAIYDRHTLCEVKYNRMPMHPGDYEPEPVRRQERYEILDFSEKIK
jgi:hypothetical protein